MGGIQLTYLKTQTIIGNLSLITHLYAAVSMWRIYESNNGVILSTKVDAEWKRQKLIGSSSYFAYIAWNTSRRGFFYC